LVRHDRREQSGHLVGGPSWNGVTDLVTHTSPGLPGGVDNRLSPFSTRYAVAVGDGLATTRVTTATWSSNRMSLLTR
jgi:hypothetical protein